MTGLSDAAPQPELADRVAAVLGWTPQAWREVRGGYTPAARYVVSAGGDSAFVKVATTPLTAAMLRREIAAYQVVAGAFRPALIGHDDQADAPLLIIEDLSAADWPPPWTEARVAQALDAVTELHRQPGAALRPFAMPHGQPDLGWQVVAADPAPFLSVGLASADWLARALPALQAAEVACPTEGETAAHWDLRSDNICFRGGRACFIDWAEACRSDPRLDLGFWLPSLRFEGGPPPEAILPDAPEVAAWVAGFFACRAGLPVIPDAPFVRRVQREQLSTALPWAIRALGLPQP